MFTKLLRRNLIMMLIPVLVIQILIIFMVIQLGLLPAYSTKRINDISRVSTLYKEDVMHVTFNYDTSNMVIPEYAGYDEMVNGERVGGYYYIYEGDNIRLFVLTDETIKLLDSGKNIEINAYLDNSEEKVKLIENALAEKLNLSENVFEGLIDPVIINETAFPALKIAVTQHSAEVVTVLLIITVLYGVLAFSFPKFIFGIDQKDLAKTKSELIAMMDEEMNERMEEHEGSEYTTENYKIFAYVSHIEIIKR